MSGHTVTAQAHPNIAFIKYWGNTWAKVSPLRSFYPKSPLPSVLQCVPSEYLMKAKFWENIFRKADGFSSGLAIPNPFQLEESRAVGQTLLASRKLLNLGYNQN